MTLTKIAATHILADYETERPAVPTIDGQLFIAAIDGNVDIGLGGAWVSLLASLVIIDDHAIHDNTAGEIVAITEKATPVGGDVLLMEDSQAIYAKKRVRLDEMVVTIAEAEPAAMYAKMLWLDAISDPDIAQYLLADGTRPLSANWDAGSWQIRAETLQSDIAPGTAPLTVASTTLVANLNADLHNNYHQSDLEIMNWMF